MYPRYAGNRSANRYDGKTLEVIVARFAIERSFTVDFDEGGLISRADLSSRLQACDQPCSEQKPQAPAASLAGEKSISDRKSVNHGAHSGRSNFNRSTALIFNPGD
jgi:hypothetical protein